MTKQYHDIQKLSDALQTALRLTLKVSESTHVFTGNEEKVWLYALLQRLSTYQSMLEGRLPTQCFPTALKFYEIYSVGPQSELAGRFDLKKVAEIFRAWLIKCRNIFNTFDYLLFLRNDLMKSRNVLHYAACLRNESRVVPNLTDHFELSKRSVKKNAGLRRTFFENLLGQKIPCEIAHFILEYFPTSHLELYSYFDSHDICQLTPQKVLSSVYGIMDDPILSFMVKKSQAKLIYVQHGGGYGLNKTHVGHRLEKEGADSMYYWGTGEKNVYPTRYRNRYFARIKDDIFVAFSLKDDFSQMERDLRALAKRGQQKSLPLTAALHPNSPKKSLSVKTQRGLSYRDNEAARLVVYDDLMQSLIYPRIIAERPFLVIDAERNDERVDGEGAKEFLKQMRQCRILVDRDEIAEEFIKWTGMSRKKSLMEFRKQARSFLDLVLRQPRITELF